MLQRAVINAGPLVALSLAGRLDLLPALCREFWIPEVVYREVTVAGVGRPGADGLADSRCRRAAAPHRRRRSQCLWSGQRRHALSQEVEDYDRATEFEALGGKLIQLAPGDWKEVAHAA